MNIFVGISALMDIALLLLRLAIGVSFLLSGYFKLTRPDRRQRMEESLKEAGIAGPAAMAPVVATGELVGGACLLLGLMTGLGAVILLVITAVAFVTTIVPKAEGTGIEKFENVLYTPEGFLLPSLLTIIATGAGSISLDAMLF